MKLAEAILERRALQQHLSVLEKRVQREKEAGAPVRHLVDAIKQVSFRIRDLSIAISWTEAISNLANLCIKGHRLRNDTNFELAKLLESVDREEADRLWRSAVDNWKVVEAATWLVDLQIPQTFSEEQKKDRDQEVE